MMQYFRFTEWVRPKLLSIVGEQLITYIIRLFLIAILNHATLNKFGSVSNDDGDSEDIDKDNDILLKNVDLFSVTTKLRTKLYPRSRKQGVIRNLRLLFCRGWLRKCSIYISGAKPLISSLNLFWRRSRCRCRFGLLRLPTMVPSYSNNVRPYHSNQLYKRLQYNVRIP